MKINEKWLAGIFWQYGPIVSVRVKTAMGRTFAFVDFEDIKDACYAKTLLDETFVSGVAMKIYFSTNPDQKLFRKQAMERQDSNFGKEKIYVSQTNVKV